MSKQGAEDITRKMQRKPKATHPWVIKINKESKRAIAKRARS